MLRIIAGEKKGQILRTPKSRSVRPTTAGIRKTLFDILGPYIPETRWLDLFAGSGAVGLEALSRGATHSTLVESSHAAVAVARHNIKRLGYSDRCELIEDPAKKAMRALAGEGRVFDIVFLDPPYRGEDHIDALMALGGKRRSLIDPADGLVVAQISSRVEVRSRYGALELARDREIGDTRLCFFRLREEEIAEPAESGPAVAEEPPR